MSNINLQKDLELWVDFDERYWNPQTNRIQDQSGYGRHAEAIGGPTIGTEGPNDFEATSFDGSDDYFDTQTTVNEDSGFTVVALHRTNIQTDGISYVATTRPEDDSSTGYMLRENGTDEFSFGIFDTNNDFSGVNYSAATYTDDKWFLSVGRWTGDEITLSVNNDTIGVSNVSSFLGNNVTEIIGAKGGGDSTDLWDGDIALFGRWSRALSDAEIEELNRMTAPRRSNL